MGTTAVIGAGQLKAPSLPLSNFGLANPVMVTGHFTFSDSYLQGGEVLNLSQALSSVSSVMLASKGTHEFTYDPATGKIAAFITTTGLQPIDTANLSLLGSIAFIAIGLPL